MKKEIIFVLASGLLMTVHAAHNNNYHTDNFNWNSGSDLVETTMGAIPAAQATLVNAKTAVSEAQVAYDAIDPTDTAALAAAQEALDVANTAIDVAKSEMGTIPAAQATLSSAQTAVSEAQAAYDDIDPTDAVALSAALEALDAANTSVTTAQAAIDSARGSFANEKATMFHDDKVSFESIKAGLSGFFSEMTTMNAGHDSANDRHGDSSDGSIGSGIGSGMGNGHGDSSDGSMGSGHGGGMGGGMGGGRR